MTRASAEWAKKCTTDLKTEMFSQRHAFCFFRIVLWVFFALS